MHYPSDVGNGLNRTSFVLVLRRRLRMRRRREMREVFSCSLCEIVNTKRKALHESCQKKLRHACCTLIIVVFIKNPNSLMILFLILTAVLLLSVLSFLAKNSLSHFDECLGVSILGDTNDALLFLSPFMIMIYYVPMLIAAFLYWRMGLPQRRKRRRRMIRSSRIR